MRVVCRTVEDFLENLRSVPPTMVLQGIVYVSIHRNPLDGTKRNAVKFDVTVQADVVVNLSNDEGQYILQYAEQVGRDYEDGSQERGGSERAEEIKRKIVEHCDDVGLRVRPGVVEP